MQDTVLQNTEPAYKVSWKSILES